MPEHTDPLFPAITDLNPPIPTSTKIPTHLLKVSNKVLKSPPDLKENGFNLNIPMYMEKIIGDNLPSVEEALAELKLA